MVYDEELAMTDLSDLFKAKLNDAIDVINAEKNDALVLDHIPADSYCMEVIDEKMKNWKGFFAVYGLIDTAVKEASTANLIEDFGITMQVMIFDPGEKDRKNILYKLLRYRRALRSVLVKNPDVFRGYAKASLASLKPSVLPFDQKSVLLTIGIDVKASFAAE